MKEGEVDSSSLLLPILEELETLTLLTTLFCSALVMNGRLDGNVVLSTRVDADVLSSLFTRSFENEAGGEFISVTVVSTVMKASVIADETIIYS